MHPSIQRILIRLADALVDRRSQPVPAPTRLERARIISHRGQHDNTTCLENTMAAFGHSAAAGVWGIELDIRWSRDHEPMVFHDPDLHRLFGLQSRLDRFTLAGLGDRFPAIPPLADVVARFGGQVHLMIEVKHQPWKHRVRQVGRLQEVLQPLRPGRDFHLISLTPRMLMPFSGYPPEVLVAIADGWPARLSRWVLERGWGGLCGHYLLLHRAMVRRHHERGQAVGTGFAGSRHCLFRELNRGIDWIFSNDAAGLQAVVNRENMHNNQERATDLNEAGSG